MARNTYYVNTSSTTGSQDGTTNTPGSSGTAAFASLYQAITTIADDLSAITADDVEVKGYTFSDIALEIICDGSGGPDTDSGGGTYPIWLGNDEAWSNESTTKRVLIRASDDYWHDNLKLGTGYSIQVDTPNSRAVWFHNGTYGAYVVAGIEINQTGTGTSSALSSTRSSIADSEPKCQFFSCIFRTANTDECVHGAALSWFYCCRIEGGTGFDLIDGTLRPVYIFNCLVANAASGYENNTTSDGFTRLINNAAFNISGDDFAGTYTMLEADYNASEDATATNYGSNSITGLASGDFADTASDDYTPSGSSDLTGAGEDLVTAGHVAYRVDAMGNTRPTGDTWAIGPLEPAGGSAVTGTGTPAAQDSTIAGTGEREITGNSVLAVQAAAVAGTGSVQVAVQLVLTAANSRELRDETDTVLANLTGIVWEWYDTPGSTSGDPVDSGTFDTDANGEATINVLGSALTDGQFGQLVLYHPSNTSIRGTYRIPVTDS